MWLTALLLSLLPWGSYDNIVTTNNGPVKGISLSTKNVQAYLGIPYAEPPVGSLRFAKPVAKSSWQETYEAHTLPPSCIQAPFGESSFKKNNDQMSEDCLYLNLWVPEGGSKGSKPVMVYIHGGAWMTGSSNWAIYDGANLAEHGDVIVASINYRVGTLGFFCAFTDEAAGSMGMFDQVMAIKWIKDNAKHFGGDPDNIVLFGESAGSYSVSLHLISPLSKNLFRRAILISGSSINPMFTDDNRVLRKISQEFADLSGCTAGGKSLETNPDAVLGCMKALPAEKFAESDKEFWKNYGEFFWRMVPPRVGDAFLPENPMDLFRKGGFKDKEILLGVNRDEGPFLLVLKDAALFGALGEKAEHVDFNEDSAKSYLQNLTNTGDRGEYGKVFQSYLDRVNTEPGYTYLKAINEIAGDQLINCGVVFQAEHMASSDIPVYFYLFAYRPDSTTNAQWMGVTHCDALQYVFGNPLNEDLTESEVELSKRIMDILTAFVRSGNPSIPGVEWPNFSHQEPKYVTLGKTSSIGVRPDNHRCELWRKLFRAVID